MQEDYSNSSNPYLRYASQGGRAEHNRKVAPQHNATKPRHQELIAALVACACIALIALAALGKLPFQRKMVTAADFASNAKSDWRLVLINETHPMEPYAPELTLLRNEQAVDSRCYPDLQRMFDDMRALGLHPYVNSSYRSREVQQQVYDTTLQAFMSEGMTESEAWRKTERTVAKPGMSEHETGLAIDVVSEEHTWEYDEAVYEWMAAHSWEYGWIVRYPANKVDITGIDNEPWHFRYVGTEAAREMYETGQCLEEYVGAA